jgi:hypothetical protein
MAEKNKNIKDSQTGQVTPKKIFLTNRFMSRIGHFNTQNNPVITNPVYNKQK